MRSSNVTAAALPESFCLAKLLRNAKAFGVRMGQPPFFLLRALPLKAPLQKHGLEGKIEAATEHSEIIFRPVDHAEAQVVSQTDVPRDSEFETGSELAERFRFATEVVRLGADSERIRRPLCGEDIPFAAAENRTGTGPGVGRNTGAGNWIAQCKCSQNSANGMVVIDFFSSKNRDRRVLKDIEAVFAGVQGKSFNAHTKVAVEEIFYVGAAAPGVIASDVSVVGAEHRVAFTGTLYDIH